RLAKSSGLLRDALRVLASELDLDRFLQHMLRSTAQMLDAHSAGLMLFDPETGRVEPYLNVYTGAWGVSEHPPVDPLSVALQDNQSFAGLRAVFQRPISYVYDDIKEMKEWPEGIRDVLIGLGIRSFVSLPLIVADRVLGRFVVRFSDHRAVGAEDMELLHAL